MDLNAPLGMTPPPEPKRRLGLVVGCCVALACLGALAATLLLSDPHAGEPTATAAIPPAATAPHGGDAAGNTPPARPGDTLASRDAATDRTPTASINQPPSRPAEVGSVENGVTVFRTPPAAQSATAQPGTQDKYAPLIIDVSRALDDPQHRPKANGAPPRISTATPNAAQPKIAIFVSGMGLNESATRTATEIMPAAVTLAFVPYGATAAAAAATAKERGHEILLQLPMQNGKAAGPGPHALSAAASAATTNDDLAWLMGRFGGYDGVTNLLGAAVSADTNVMSSVMKAVATRHLFYLDDGTSKRSVALTVAANVGVPALQADLLLDATSEPAIVRANLDALVAIARRKGSAIGMASGLPDHLAAIAQFAGELQAQGITLVPVSALTSATTTTTAR